MPLIAGSPAKGRLLVRLAGGFSSAPTEPGLESTGLSRRETVVLALVIFIAALAARVLFFTVQVMDYPQPWSHSAPFGQAEMGSIAMNLAAGRGFSSPFGPGSTPTAWLCPLIPYLWALVIKIVGSATGFTARLVIYLGTIPSAGCVVLYWLIARRVLRGSPAMRRTALLVAALFCVWPEALYAIGYGWYYPWQECGTALMVLLGMRWIDRPSAKTVVPLGIAAGVLALINVTSMPIFAVILLLPLFKSGKAGRESRRRVLGLASAGLGLAVLITVPWTIRNAVVMHAFMPLRSVGGYQLYAGNNPYGNIRDCSTERHPQYEPEEMRRYQTLGEVGYSHWGFQQAVAYIRQHPAKTLERAGERAYVIWLADALDYWSWDGTSRYWRQGHAAIGNALATIVAAWGLAILMLWAFVSGRFACLPYKWLLFSIIFLLPLPYYLTIADYNYTQILRSWLLLLVILAFSAGFRRPGRDRTSTAES